MAYLGCGDDRTFGSESSQLSGTNHVAIDGPVSSSRPSLLPGACPKSGSLPHRFRRHRKVLEETAQSVEPLEAPQLSRPEKLTTHLVVRDFRDEDACLTGDQTFVPNIFWAKPEDYKKATQRVYCGSRQAPDRASLIELPLVGTP